MKFEGLIPHLSGMENTGVVTRNEDGKETSLPNTHTHLPFSGMGAMWEWALKTYRAIHASKHTALPLVHLMLTFSQSVSFKTSIYMESCSGGDDSYLRWLAVGDIKGKEGKGRQKREMSCPLTRHCSQCLSPRWDLLSQAPFDMYSKNPKDSALPVSSLSWYLTSKKNYVKEQRCIITLKRTTKKPHCSMMQVLYFSGTEAIPDIEVKIPYKRSEENLDIIF